MKNIESNIYNKTSLEVSELVNEKEKAYGKAFKKSKEILKILYPDGIPVDKYLNVLATVRVIDKLFRIANDSDAFGESPWQDIMGYALLGLINDLEEKEKSLREE